MDTLMPSADLTTTAETNFKENKAEKSSYGQETTAGAAMTNNKKAKKSISNVSRSVSAEKLEEEEEPKAVSFGFDMPVKPVSPLSAGITPPKLVKQDFLSIFDVDERLKLESARVVLTRLGEEDLIKFSLQEEMNAVAAVLVEVENVQDDVETGEVKDKDKEVEVELAKNAEKATEDDEVRELRRKDMNRGIRRM